MTEKDTIDLHNTDTPGMRAEKLFKIMGMQPRLGLMERLASGLQLYMEVDSE